MTEAAESEYEQAEAAYLDGIRANADRPTMRSLAADVAAKADAWNSAAYHALHASESPEREQLDATTERTEVLSDLWADLHRAYGA